MSQASYAYPDSPVVEFYKYLSGYRTEPLNQYELIQVFRTPPTPELLAAYRSALQPPKLATQRTIPQLNPDLSLVSALASTRSREYLLPVAYALRAGGNANLYVAMPNVGIVHLLVYVIRTLGLTQPPVDQEVLVSALALLLLSGARVNMMVYANQPGSLGENNPRLNQTVLEWARQAMPSLPLEKMSRSIESLDPLFRIRLGILLNRPDLVPGITPESEDPIFRSQAFNLLNRLPASFLQRSDPHRRPPLNSAMHYFFPEGYAYVIRTGLIPNFFQINDLLLEYRRVSNSALSFLSPILAQMLLEAIASGASLSSEQMSFLRTLSGPLTEEVQRVAEVPLWEKICRTPEGTLPKEFIPLLLSFGYDPLTPKSLLCEELKLLSQTPPEMLLRAAETRQGLRLRSQLGRPNEFLTGQTPELTCANRALMTHPMTAYPDLDIAFYRDSAGKVWCFTSDTFENLLSNPRNPYSGAELPNEFLTQLRAQVEIRRSYGLGSAPVTFETHLKRLLEKDPLPSGGSYRESDLYRTFLTLMASRGISEAEITGLDVNQLSQLSQKLIPGVKYDGLPKSLQLETFARVVTGSLANGQNDQFFNEMREGLNLRP